MIVRILAERGAELLLELAVLLDDALLHLFLPERQLVRDLRVGHADDLRREDRRVLRAVDRHRRHRDAGGHLHRREQGVQTVEGGGFDRDADDRQRRVRRQHTRQVRRLARRRDDRGKAVVARRRRELARERGGPVRAHDVDLHADAKPLEGIDRALDDRQVAVAAHNNRYFFVRQFRHFPFHFRFCFLQMKNRLRSLATCTTSAKAWRTRPPRAPKGRLPAGCSSPLMIRIRPSEEPFPPPPQSKYTSSLQDSASIFNWKMHRFERLEG